MDLNELLEWAKQIDPKAFEEKLKLKNKIRNQEAELKKYNFDEEVKKIKEKHKVLQ